MLDQAEDFLDDGFTVGDDRIAAFFISESLGDSLKFQFDYTVEYYKWSLVGDSEKSKTTSDMVKAFESYSDIEFICRDGIVKSHKNVLSQKSEVRPLLCWEFQPKLCFALAFQSNVLLGHD